MGYSILETELSPSSPCPRRVGFLKKNNEKIKLSRVFKGEFSYVNIFNANLGKKKY